jgi:hypothetical protein
VIKKDVSKPLSSFTVFKLCSRYQSLTQWSHVSTLTDQEVDEAGNHNEFGKAMVLDKERPIGNKAAQQSRKKTPIHAVC